MVGAVSMNTVWCVLHMLEGWGFVTCWGRFGGFGGFGWVFGVVGCGESRVDLGKGREISWRKEAEAGMHVRLLGLAWIF
jgi:hypothetical protein